jgi:hypothetical protein
MQVGAMSRGSTRIAFVCGAAAMALVGCPEEEEAASVSSDLVIPDRVTSGDAVVLVRIGGGQTTTSSEVHKRLGELFDVEQVAARDGVLRGGDQTASGSLAEALAGGAGQQMKALMQRVLVDKAGPFSAEEAVDACGNPMLAAFVTPAMLQEILPAGGGVSLGSVSSAAAGHALAGQDDAIVDGVWDITLTERRRDGMLDALIQIYPDVNAEKPGIMGHFFGAFLTANNPGFWQFPMYLSAEKVQVSLQALMQWEVSYHEPQFEDAREVYVFPHKSRTVALKDVQVVGLGDPLCDEHYEAVYGGYDVPLPFGCNLPDERDLPVMLDVGSPLGKALYRDVMSRGKNSQPLEQMADVLKYQISAFLACPTFTEPAYIAYGPVHAMICPDGDPSLCLGFHDMEEVGCATSSLTPVEKQVTSPTGEISLSTHDWPYLVTLGELDPLLGSPSGFELTYDANAGEVVTIYTPSFGRLRFEDPTGRQMQVVEKDNTHGCGKKYEWTFTRAGEHRVVVSGTQDLRIGFTSPEAHAP